MQVKFVLWRNRKRKLCKEIDRIKRKAVHCPADYVPFHLFILLFSILFHFLLSLWLASLENLATDSAEDNIKLKTNSTELQESGSNNRNKEPEDSVERTTPVDWKPQKACYFCVDGKLLTVNERGEVVAEPGPVPAEPELANKVWFCFLIKLNPVNEL